MDTNQPLNPVLFGPYKASYMLSQGSHPMVTKGINYLDHIFKEGGLSTEERYNIDIANILDNQIEGYEIRPIVNKPQAVNTWFFNYLKTREDSTVVSPIRDRLNEIEASKLAVLSKKISPRVRELKNWIESTERNINSIIYNLENEAANLFRYKRKLEDAMNLNSSSKIIGEVNKIIEKGDFEYIGIGEDDQNVICFRTSQDVVLTHTNLAAGIYEEFNFGKYDIDVHLLDGRIKVYGSREGYLYKGSIEYPHPHISSSNDPCYGSFKIQGPRLLSDLDLAEFFEKFNYILRQYNPENPYRTLSDYIESQRRYLAQQSQQSEAQS